MPMHLLFLLIALAPVDRPTSGDWPQFRGPDLNPAGASDRLPDHWSKTENVEWMAEIPGRGWSSPIVTGGKVFLTTATTEGKSKRPQIGATYSTDYERELRAS